MLKRFAFSVLSAAMVLSLGTGAAFASQGDRVSTAKAPLVGSIQQQTANLYVSWAKNSGADIYQLSIRNTDTNQILQIDGVKYENFPVTRDYRSIPRVPTGNYRVWVGAFNNGNLIGQDIKDPVIVSYGVLNNVWLNPQYR
ncbi:MULTISPECIES: hypothetical protein [Bacillales]|uniref:hypothetical protein n=1 Tax=Bacillales TaxID=1385 RepID=UPI00035D7B27|nr:MULTISPECIES: hypothetical protein [Bacillales]KMZ42304.1 hypothetical protein AC624_14955 [Bacillus sp. FJAT-27238]